MTMHHTHGHKNGHSQAHPTAPQAAPVTDEILNLAVGAVLPLLVQEVVGAPAADILALEALPAMWESGQISLAGYATALWLRLKERTGLRAYYSAAGVPNIWFDARRYELSQWNALALTWWTERTVVVEAAELGLDVDPAEAPAEEPAEEPSESEAQP